MQGRFTAALINHNSRDKDAPLTQNTLNGRDGIVGAFPGQDDHIDRSWLHLCTFAEAFGGTVVGIRGHARVAVHRHRPFGRLIHLTLRANSSRPHRVNLR